MLIFGTMYILDEGDRLWKVDDDQHCNEVADVERLNISSNYRNKKFKVKFCVISYCTSVLSFVYLLVGCINTFRRQLVLAQDYFLLRLKQIRTSQQLYEIKVGEMFFCFNPELRATTNNYTHTFPQYAADMRDNYRK